MKIAVLGSGAWGTALAMVLLENGHDVTLWSYSPEESAVLAQTGENPMLKGVALPKTLGLTSSLNAVQDCKVVVLATPSFAVRATARQLAGLIPQDAVIVSVSKGIEKDTSLTLTQVIEEELGEDCKVVALSGPSHAEEVGRGVPTTVVSASKSQAAAELVQDLFMNERFRVYASDDVLGVELAAALKNVIALCAGCCDGMGFG
ncbi:MAG: NAD(P)-binding domain-containing protein, partial [Pseudoflavonifractor sp.]